MEFDSDAFQLPFFRVHRVDGRTLTTDLCQLRSQCERFVIDAKAPSDDIAAANILMAHGFRKVCTQLVLTHSLLSTEPLSEGADISAFLNLDEETVREHAKNFRYDRFSLDPLLPASGRQHLYFNWITNSLTSGHKMIAHVGRDFCSFSEKPEGISVDLLSVLQTRRGIGSKLVNSVVGHAFANGFQKVIVTTECENNPAWRLYLRCGFQVLGFVSVFHLVHP